MLRLNNIPTGNFTQLISTKPFEIKPPDAKRCKVGQCVLVEESTFSSFYQINKLVIILASDCKSSLTTKLLNNLTEDSFLFPPTTKGQGVQFHNTRKSCNKEPHHASDGFQFCCSCSSVNQVLSLASVRVSKYGS